MGERSVLWGQGLLLNMAVKDQAQWGREMSETSRHYCTINVNYNNSEVGWNVSEN